MKNHDFSKVTLSIGGVDIVLANGPLPRDVGKAAVQAVLDGDPDMLYEAFFWDETRQGHEHWEDRAVGRVPLSDDDRAYLLGLL